MKKKEKNSVIFHKGKVVEHFLKGINLMRK